MSIALAQEPQTDPARAEPPRAETPAAAPAVRLLPDSDAKAAIASFQKALAGNASLAAKTRALEQLAPGAHPLFVKPLGKVVETDKSIVVRKQAATLLAQQPAKQTKPELMRLLKSDRVQSDPPVVATLIGGLARCDYQPKDWQLIDGMFEREYSADRVPVQEAILELVARCKEKQAVNLLLRNLDEPVPANVDDPSNPPAEYWEGRWKAWQVWRGRVKEALFALTGQRFSTATEARAWLRKNPIE
jgi:hypothetical protein